MKLGESRILVNWVYVHVCDICVSTHYLQVSSNLGEVIKIFKGESHVVKDTLRMSTIYSDSIFFPFSFSKERILLSFGLDDASVHNYHHEAY